MTTTKYRTWSTATLKTWPASSHHNPLKNVNVKRNTNRIVLIFVIVLSIVSVVGTKGIIVVAVTDGPLVLGAGHRSGDSAHQKDIVVLLLPHCGMAVGNASNRHKTT
jgi:hypothetical protein